MNIPLKSRIILVLGGLALLALAWSLAASPLIPVQVDPGFWYSFSEVHACPSGQICAEWIQAGGAMDGAQCCISSLDLDASSFNVCVTMLRGPRGGGDAL